LRLRQHAGKAVAEIPGTQAPHIGDPAPAETVRRLVEACRPGRMCLFGSVARGEAGPDSNDDLF